jgi:hypothetical protein
MFYAAKCYWPGVTEAEVRRSGARATEATEAARASVGDVSYVGSILFPDDALVLCLFQALSRSAVRKVTRHADIPCERIMDSVWLARPGSERNASCAGSDCH